MLRNEWVTEDFIPKDKAFDDWMELPADSTALPESIPCCVDPEFSTNSVSNVVTPRQKPSVLIYPDVATHEEAGLVLSRSAFYRELVTLPVLLSHVLTSSLSSVPVRWHFAPASV